MKCLFSIILIFLVASCAPVQTVEQSREQLWQQYGGKKLDEVLLGWGAPDAETHLSDGARLVKYQRSTTYDAGSRTSRRTSCEVSFLAKPSQFLIENVAMEGNQSDCRQLAGGKRGAVELLSPDAMSVGVGGGFGRPTYGGYGGYRIPY